MKKESGYAVKQTARIDTTNKVTKQLASMHGIMRARKLAKMHD